MGSQKSGLDQEIQHILDIVFLSLGCPFPGNTALETHLVLFLGFGAQLEGGGCEREGEIAGANNAK